MKDAISQKILIAVLIISILIFSSAPQSYAQSAADDAKKPTLTGQLVGCARWTQVLTVSCLLHIIGVVLDVGLKIAHWFLGLVSNIFNYFLGFTINNANYAGIGAVEEGWRFSRDVVNIFFIFILLFIAIATILGIESYGAKALLPRLIIIALLVNFSLLATQAIIFIANALTIQLYNAQTTISEDKTLAGGGFSQTAFRKDFAGQIQKGLRSQALFFEQSPLRKDLAESERITINTNIILTIVAGIFMFIFAAFIFMAGSFFLVVRMVILWILMVLAPFGFVFLILPATRGYAQSWWRKLTDQALFAPAFMFFLVLSVKMINSDIVGSLSRRSSGAITQEYGILLLFLQYFVILLLLGATLIVAKSLSIYGAGAAISMAAGAGKAFRGYAGKIGRRTAVSAAAPIAGAIARSPLGRIPILGGAARATAAAGRKSIEDYQKEIEKYSTRELKQAIGGPRVRPVQSAAIMQELVKRGDVSLEHGLTERKLRGTHAEMQRLNMNTRDLERLWPELAVPQAQADAVEAESTETRLGQMNRREGPQHLIREAARRMRPADIEKLDESISRQPHSMEAVAASASAGINQKFVERGGELFNGLENAYRRLAVSFARSRGRIITDAEVAFEDVAEALEHVGNRAGANFMSRGQARLAFGFNARPVAGGRAGWAPPPPGPGPAGGGGGWGPPPGTPPGPGTSPPGRGGTPPGTPPPMTTPPPPPSRSRPVIGYRGTAMTP